MTGGEIPFRKQGLLPESVPRSCTRDEGRPLEAGVQAQALNHLKLHGLNARVVSVEGKGMAEDRAR
jgi:hypothetical protein